jgi:hypothetical protein
MLAWGGNPNQIEPFSTLGLLAMAQFNSEAN